VKPSWTNNIHFKNENRRVKQVLSRGGYEWKGCGHKERWNEVDYGGYTLHSYWIHFAFIYENRRMKSVEIVLRRGSGEEGE
jgi:hypothetical protein